jgi:hypothetical protein
MKHRADDLETRVANRKRELIAEIIEHKKNSSRYGAAGEIDRIKDHLSELSQILKGTGCIDLSAGARVRLAEWAAR